MSLKVNCLLQAYLNRNYSAHCVASHLRRQFASVIKFVQVIVGNPSGFDARALELRRIYDLCSPAR